MRRFLFSLITALDPNGLFSSRAGLKGSCPDKIQLGSSHGSEEAPSSPNFSSDLGSRVLLKLTYLKGAEWGEQITECYLQFIQ